MTGLRILVGVFVVAALVVGYLMWPSSEDVDRRLRPIDQHKQDIETALTDCTELVRYFDQRKHTLRKKMELSRLKTDYEKLENLIEESATNEQVENREKLLALEDLEQRSYELKRNCEDLRARLREMQKWYEELLPVQAELGRHRVALAKLQEASTDVLFQQRGNELIDKARQARKLAEQGLQEVSFSIIKGRPIVESSLNQLKEINKSMAELIDAEQQRVAEESGDAAEKTEAGS